MSVRLTNSPMQKMSFCCSLLMCLARSQNLKYYTLACKIWMIIHVYNETTLQGTLCWYLPRDNAQILPPIYQVIFLVCPPQLILLTRRSGSTVQVEWPLAAKTKVNIIGAELHHNQQTLGWKPSAVKAILIFFWSISFELQGYTGYLAGMLNSWLPNKVAREHKHNRVRKICKLETQIWLDLNLENQAFSFFFLNCF